MPQHEETPIVRNASTPSTEAERIEDLEGPRSGSCGCEWLGVHPLAPGSCHPARLRPCFPTGSHPTMNEVGFCLHWAMRAVRVATNALGWFSFSPRNTTQALPLGLSGKLSGKWLHLCPPRNPGIISKFIRTIVPTRGTGVSRSSNMILYEIMSLLPSGRL